MTHSTWDNWLYSNWCLVEPPEYLSTWHILVCLSWWTVGGLWWICAVSQAWLGWYHETHPYFSFTSKQLQRQDDLYNRKLKVTSLDILSPTGPKERLRSKEASWSLRELPFRNVITHIFYHDPAIGNLATTLQMKALFHTDIDCSITLPDCEADDISLM